MMDYLVVCLAALVASGLTLFSGFGLGTILTPVFATFFPVATAVAMTAVVHLANTLFKIGLVGRDADRPIVLRFGLPAALAAVGGAALLVLFTSLPPLGSYELAGRAHEITPSRRSLEWRFVRARRSHRDAAARPTARAAGRPRGGARSPRWKLSGLAADLRAEPIGCRNVGCPSPSGHRRVRG